MCEEKIKAVVMQFAKEAKKIYGAALRDVCMNPAQGAILKVIATLT